MLYIWTDASTHKDHPSAKLLFNTSAFYTCALIFLLVLHCIRDNGSIHPMLLCFSFSCSKIKLLHLYPYLYLWYTQHETSCHCGKWTKHLNLFSSVGPSAASVINNTAINTAFATGVVKRQYTHRNGKGGVIAMQSITEKLMYAQKANQLQRPANGDKPEKKMHSQFLTCSTSLIYIIKEGTQKIKPIWTINQCIIWKYTF